MLTILWYDNFCKNQTPLQRNGMAAIPKMLDFISHQFHFTYTVVEIMRAWTVDAKRTCAYFLGPSSM